MAPKRIATGLDESMEAAPVLWGGLPPVVEAGREAEGEALRERVAVETVLLALDEGMAETEAALLVTADAADEAMEDAAEDAADAADESAEDADASTEDADAGALEPPESGNWPEFTMEQTGTETLGATRLTTESFTPTRVLPDGKNAKLKYAEYSLGALD
ncbi:hypothetical protein HBI56_210500 [Parastagonospora nodorum]|nr:hypothetical protein HBH53_196620 [Parastagonospora nodorum]KAH3960984.1 hypothetical protein HBH51_186440 [Parastagonospora nodorum]KAH3992690.1 hypothetical protein HBI10_212100 [Parastagonospora nodorum]KAH4018229.1 hypothetical protein HBI09_191580 [Parastagonospora nodorum]KAH4029704.1 hypothetical protein HBI13_031410 [Parastagonospora nodorum]